MSVSVLVSGSSYTLFVGSDIASHMYISSHTPAYVSLVHCGQSSVSESEVGVLSADYSHLPILSLRIGPSTSLLFYILFHTFCACFEATDPTGAGGCTPVHIPNLYCSMYTSLEQP